MPRKNVKIVFFCYTSPSWSKYLSNIFYHLFHQIFLSETNEPKKNETWKFNFPIDNFLKRKRHSALTLHRNKMQKNNMCHNVCYSDTARWCVIVASQSMTHTYWTEGLKAVNNSIVSSEYLHEVWFAMKITSSISCSALPILSCH